MAVTSLKAAFPRLSLIERQTRCLKQVAFGMMPLILESLDAKQTPAEFSAEKSPRQEKA